MIKIEIDKYSLKALQDQINKKWESQVLSRLIDVCDEAIKKQWILFSPIGFNDLTGQLRSSTGYLIYHNGQVVHEMFELASYGSDKEPGLQIGRKLAFAELRETTGWGIVFVAGMEYASWVQTNHNRSVLVDAEMIVRKNLLSRLDEIMI